MNDWPCALEYGEDVPVYPRAIRVWLFHAYRRRLEWLACHHREELVSQTKSEMTVARWIFFPPGRRHRFQARIRGALLMAWSNKFGGMLLTTGNKSEIAVGYCTLYGDMCGALAPIGDLLKTDVYALARHINKKLAPRYGGAMHAEVGSTTLGRRIGRVLS